MQHEVKRPIPLLDRKGHLVEAGWARHPVFAYDRKAIKATAWKIKEWDYYAIVNHAKGYAVTATMSDLGYASLFALSYIDFNRGACAQKDAISFLTFGKLGLSKTSTEDSQISWANKTLRFAFIKKGAQRHLLFACPSLELPDGSVGLDVSVTLTQDPHMETMNIATSWEEKRKAFYLNEKVNCMPAKGTIRRGMEQEHLQDGDAWGVLDWGRGRWTYQNRWYWGSASGLLENVPFGFNIGYGFSDRTCASENVLFYNGKIHKLDDVVFHIPETGYREPWTFSSNDNRFNLSFKPAVDRASTTDFIVIKSNQHQVFGWFSGTVVLDDKTELFLDAFPGFAEDVANRW
ncbi:Protein of unknown function (DUF2804) [Sphaerochaeta pleomorpha str. Grapes]|uniref:DUF2804 domain-containing protein n=1 Tax=Sphaerochaeta pleomorpha (strain ATCC BAA-1885 / DSM 22778 / Grapes) TaxID=158190 RepID=G8QS35_SPHPG|nr:DUF2804 domain-containing protein [Sphaerochaeta pleomorpha]AEV28896.1 Protein of unknown function (DUF2804) [Sphaerochaeta pleomorpha str. Grapes]